MSKTAPKSDEERLAAYAGALEAIIRSLPGGPVVNGVPMSNDDALTDLRQRFYVDALVIEQAVLRAGIISDAESKGSVHD